MYTKLLTTVSLSWLNWCHQSAPVADHGSTRRKKFMTDEHVDVIHEKLSRHRLHIFSWYVIFLRFTYFTFFLFQNNSAGERIFLYIYNMIFTFQNKGTDYTMRRSTHTEHARKASLHRQCRVQFCREPSGQETDGFAKCLWCR